MQNKKAKSLTSASTMFTAVVSLLLVFALISTLFTFFEFDGSTGDSGANVSNKDSPLEEESEDIFTVLDGTFRGSGSYYRQYGGFDYSHGEEGTYKTSDLGFTLKSGLAEFGGNADSESGVWVTAEGRDYLEIGKVKDGVSTTLSYVPTVSDFGYIFETDFCFLGSQADTSDRYYPNYYIQFSFLNQASEVFLPLYIYQEEGTSYYAFSTSREQYSNKTLLREGEWYNLSALITVKDTSLLSVVLKVNDKIIEEITLTTWKNYSCDTFTDFRIFARSSVYDMIFYLDNTCIVTDTSE